jgi:hypothetical protein
MDRSVSGVDIFSLFCAMFFEGYLCYKQTLYEKKLQHAPLLIFYWRVAFEERPVRRKHRHEAKIRRNP